MRAEYSTDKNTVNARNYRNRLRGQGLCIRCRNPVEPERAGKSLCVACARIQREKAILRRERLHAAGLCEICGKRPARPGVHQCMACGIKHAADAAARRERKAEAEE